LECGGKRASARAAPARKSAGSTEFQQSNFCSRVLRTPAVFPKHGCSKMVAQMYDEKNPPVTDCRYSTVDVRSRARKGAEKQESNLEAGTARPTPARSGLRALPTLCASGVKDWRRSFWSAVLQHGSCFGWRDDFHVVQSLVQAGPRWAVGLDEASPSNALFYCAVRTAFLWR